MQEVSISINPLCGSLWCCTQCINTAIRTVATELLWHNAPCEIQTPTNAFWELQHDDLLQIDSLQLSGTLKAVKLVATKCFTLSSCALMSSLSVDSRAGPFPPVQLKHDQISKCFMSVLCLGFSYRGQKNVVSFFVEDKPWYFMFPFL